MPAPLAQTRHAFTLVEVLLTVAISSVILVLGTTLVNQFASSWQQTRNRLAAHAEARAALDQLTDDLASIVARHDGTEWLRIMPPAPGDPPAPWLLFLAASRDAAPHTEGEVTALSYRLAPLALPGEPTPRLALFRTALDPTTALDALGQQDLHQALWAARDPATTALDNALARDIYALDIIAHFLLPDGTTRRLDVTSGLRVARHAIPDAAPTPPLPASARLQALHVELSAILPDRSTTFDLAAPRQANADQIARHTHRYARTIPLPTP